MTEAAVLYCTVLYCTVLTWSRRSQEWESATRLLLLSSRHTLRNIDIYLCRYCRYLCRYFRYLCRYYR